MGTSKKTSISIETTLYQQAEVLAQSLNISANEVVEIAIKAFIKTHQDQDASTQIGEERSIVNQGDIYWIQTEASDSDIAHPHLIVQDNIFNHSRIKTVVACALTTNMRKMNVQGNVLLDIGEANLPKQSIVEASKITTLDKTQLGDYIGTLSEQRVKQVLASLRFLQQSFLRR